MTIETTVNGCAAVIRPDGWLDTQSAPELGEAVETLGEGVTEIELNMEKLEYISSAGLRQIVAIYKKVSHLTLTHVSDEIMDVLRMTGIDKRLEIK